MRVYILVAVKRARYFLPALFLFLPARTAEARLFVFPDFPWGENTTEVEIAAGGKGWRLAEKTLDPDRRELIYRTVFLEKECRISFLFTPVGDKLFSVRAEWEGSGFGYVLAEKFKKRYRTPREEMPLLKTYIWSRQYTEVELRHDGDSTRLIFSNLNLWTEYREEMKRIKEMQKEQEGE